MQPGLAVDVLDVSKSFLLDGSVVEVLDHISLHARAGEFITLIGPSGSGKSTLFNILCGLLEADSGEILLDGKVARQRLGRLAYMPQKDLLLPWRNVLDNVILGAEIAGTPRHEARQRAQQLMALGGLEGFERSYPSVLSGGMKQRAAFLRAIMQDCPAILLDEPFGALDALTRTQLQEWLLDTWLQFRQTVFFITHDVEEAVFLSDRIYVLTPRPAKVKEMVTVELPRPRHRDLTTSSTFVALKEHLLAALQ